MRRLAFEELFEAHGGGVRPRFPIRIRGVLHMRSDWIPLNDDHPVGSRLLELQGSTVVIERFAGLWELVLTGP